MPPQHYQKIAKHLREAINNGRLNTGDELPSEAELCEQFGSSRGPVRQAMMLLRTEGMISTGRGRRSTVLSRSGNNDFDSTISISAWLRYFGFTPGQRTLLLARQPADETIAGHLRLSPGDHVVTLRRLRLADRRPFAIECTHFPVPVGRHILDADTDATSIMEHLADSAIVVDNLSRCINAVVADEEEAELLDVRPGDPLMRIRMTASDQYGQIIFFADNLFLAENLTLSLNTVRGTPSSARLSPVD
ncbi:GntR family transcriptional regulator [Corynebacterium sp.]|uniref:GntR family transcriptional regulator n=1 Tax=Corynebacterium sp. TaxID=1720 RepID=UPI0019BBB590|nr:GntR family transcriptional regulator [Corynebacterium sp.]HHU66866.1 GntR family transcriptional regulator [Corynebacterium sp.]